MQIAGSEPPLPPPTFLVDSVAPGVSSDVLPGLPRIDGNDVILVPTPPKQIAEAVVVMDPDQPPVIIKEVRPKVPAGASGEVRVQLLVTSEGKVTRVKVLDQSPYAELIAAAAAQCEFRPAKKRGRAVPTQITVTFALGTRQ